MTRDRNSKLPAPINGEVLPSTSANSYLPAPYPAASMPDTAMRGIVATFHRWGMKRIGDAIAEQNRAESELVKLHHTRLELTKARARSEVLGDIRQHEKDKIFAQMAVEQEQWRQQEEQRTANAHDREMAAFDRKMQLMAKKREVRVAEEIDKRNSVAKVAGAKENALLARKRLEAAGHITKAQVEKIVLDALHYRNEALKKEAVSDGEAQIVDAARRQAPTESAPENESDYFTDEEVNDGVIAEFEHKEEQRGLSSGEREILKRLKAFMDGRRNAQK